MVTYRSNRLGYRYLLGLNALRDIQHFMVYGFTGSNMMTCIGSSGVSAQFPHERLHQCGGDIFGNDPTTISDFGQYWTVNERSSEAGLNELLLDRIDLVTGHVVQQKSKACLSGRTPAAPRSSRGQKGCSVPNPTPGTQSARAVAARYGARGSRTPVRKHDAKLADHQHVPQCLRSGGF